MRLIDADAFIARLDHVPMVQEAIKKAMDHMLTVDAVEVVRCKDCVFGHLYVDVQNGVTDSWIECRNLEGLNRDVSVDGYCSASIRRM